MFLRERSFEHAVCFNIEVQHWSSVFRVLCCERRYAKAKKLRLELAKCILLLPLHHLSVIINVTKLTWDHRVLVFVSHSLLIKSVDNFTMRMSSKQKYNNKLALQSRNWHHHVHKSLCHALGSFPVPMWLIFRVLVEYWYKRFDKTPSTFVSIYVRVYVYKGEDMTSAPPLSRCLYVTGHSIVQKPREFQKFSYPRNRQRITEENCKSIWKQKPL